MLRQTGDWTTWVLRHLDLGLWGSSVFVAFVNMGSGFVCGLLEVVLFLRKYIRCRDWSLWECLLSKLVVSVKLAVEKMLKDTKVVCYSDSQIVIWWLKLIRKDWKLWVENRVQIVRKNVATENWFYVPTDRNPADLATRLKSLVCLKGCLLWWQGPFCKVKK